MCATHVDAIFIPVLPTPPRMTEEEEAKLMRHVMEDSMSTYDERQWVGLETTMALCAAGNMAMPKLEPAVVVKEEVVDKSPLAAWKPRLMGQKWGWSTTASEMAYVLGVGPWAPTPLQVSV
ncbi:hypothetical protein D1007_28385 [Hordeum vulgare]|nr:hypothetical protein D1007_28385 [Hordeum vulgare]